MLAKRRVTYGAYVYTVLANPKVVRKPKTNVLNLAGLPNCSENDDLFLVRGKT